MPPGVRFPPSPANAQEPNYNVNALVDFWIPAPSKPAELKAPFWNVVGRLRDGTTTRQAQGELKVAAATQAQADHDFEGFTPEVHSLTAEMNRDGGRILLPLLGAVVGRNILGREHAGAGRGSEEMTSGSGHETLVSTLLLWPWRWPFAAEARRQRTLHGGLVLQDGAVLHQGARERRGIDILDGQRAANRHRRGHPDRKSVV